MAGNVRVVEQVRCLNAQAADGWGTTIPVEQFKHVYATLIGASGAGFTIKFAGSTQETAPDFTTGATNANQWFYVASYDTNATPGTPIGGSTGYVISGDGLTNYLLNHDEIKWVNVEVDNYANGTATVDISYTNNS